MIFLEEIDTALYDILSKIKIDGKEVKVTYKFPDKSLFNTTYPLISYSDYSITKSNYNTNKVNLLVNVDKQNCKGIVQENKTYYDIYYQIDYWSLSKMNMNKLLSQHLKLIKPLGYLPCKNSDGIKEEIPLSLIDGYRVLDEYIMNKRLFRRSFPIKATGYIDGTIKEVTLNRNNKIEVIKLP